eukprot:CAMPEP_0184986280 /NCGR_PEP_ID=MMETSP1098-20130426/15946_1 /TAXON_ID=89044 /ORGANISM="Spumella elongata, Strain CCAP 955/1" /LENGTH=93 /DNA_ID=CAMNT_0027510479 /DNA_START=27 /DNA_END=308 /DNA_ORIENTATION=-
MAGLPGNYKDQHYMFWLGPMFGAAVAAIIYEYGALKPKRREGGGDLASRLHMSKAVRHDTKDGNNWKSVSDQEPAIPHEHTETESPMVQMTRL